MSSNRWSARGAIVAALAMLLIGGQLVTAPPVEAAVPGENGRIVFVRGGQEPGLYTMNPDGSELSRLTNSAAHAFPKWSPDGGRIAFSSTGASPNVYIINSDGSGLKDLTPGTFSGAHPAWSPDGNRIAFDNDEGIFIFDLAEGEGIPLITGDQVMAPAWSPDGSRIVFDRFDPATDAWQLWVRDVAGFGQTRLTDGAVDLWPDWSPDGSRIVFQRGQSSSLIYSINPDGSDLTGLTPAGYSSPTWSPDGTKIGFTKSGSAGFWVMNPDGSGQTRLSTTRRFGYPSWQSVQVGLSASASRIVYGQSVSVTAHLAWYQTSPNQTLSIYKIPFGGTKTLVASGVVDGSGNLSATVAIPRKTTITVEWSGDADHAAGGRNRLTVSVYPTVTGKLSGQYGSSGRYKLYHYSSKCPQYGRRCPIYTVSVAPNHKGKFVYFTLQRYRQGAWRTELAFSYHLDSESQRTVIFIYANRNIIGKAYRVHSEFRGDDDHLANTSRWSYFKVTN